MIIPKIVHFLDYNLFFYRMIDMYSKHENMYKNEIFYALICINNHKISYVNCMLIEKRRKKGGEKGVTVMAECGEGGFLSCKGNSI